MASSPILSLPASLAVNDSALAGKAGETKVTQKATVRAITAPANSLHVLGMLNGSASHRRIDPKPRYPALAAKPVLRVCSPLVKAISRETTMFQGSMTALITPFKDGKVDEDAYQSFVEWQIDEGTEAVVPCGTTGESPTLSHEEHMRVTKSCIEAAAGKVPVIAGTGSNSTEEAIELTRHAKDAGATAGLVVTPYYNKPTQEGLYQHYKAINDAVDLPIHLHTHDTSGNGVAMYLMATEAGVDAIDCALSSMAGLTSQPSFNAVVTALQNHPRCPDIDVENLQTLSDHWELLRELYYPFESGLKASTTDVYYHEIPGGQYSNLRPRAVQLGLGDRWGVIKRTYHEVNQELGNIVKVTPTSKVVADFAMFLVQNELTIADIYTKADAGEDVDFPQSVRDFFEGNIGQPHGGFPERLQKIILRGKEPLTERPGKTLPDYDWEVARADLEALIGRLPTIREQISYALYPQVFRELAERLMEYGDFRVLDTVTFLYGLELDEERAIDLEEGKRLIVKLTAIGEPDEKGIRKLFFELNGQPRQITIKDNSIKSEESARLRADKLDPSQIGASMPGKVLGLEVAVGDEVEKGQTLLTTEAMKMETSVTSPHKGKVTRLEVRVGDQVKGGDLLAIVEPS